jgi:hypothetical protein
MAACAVICAPVAHADDTDDQFWSYVQSHGMASAFKSESDAVATARAACDMRGLGIPNGGGLDHQIAKSTNYRLTDSQAAQFVGAALPAYCPIYQD